MSKINVLSHNYTGKSLVVAYIGDKGFRQQIVESSHPNWKQIYALYKQGKVAETVPLFDVREAINSKFNGKFRIVGDKVLFGETQVKGYLVDRMLFFAREGLKADRLIKFAENLYQNPSEESRNELYQFLENKHFPITDDGCFLAYKGVNSDYYSITSGNAKMVKGKVKDGRIFNGVGEKIEVERQSVDPNRRNNCSYGLHVGAWEYANNFKGSGKLMVVKVNPKDAITVPTDHSCQKCRVLAYEVIAEEGKVLHEVKDSNYDKAAKVRYHNLRDEKGHFRKVDKFTRDSLGRFCS